jgi:hypothetical protein
MLSMRAKKARVEKKTLVISKWELNLWKKPEKCYSCVLSIDLFGAETGTFRKIDQKYTGKYWDVVLEKNTKNQLH